MKDAKSKLLKTQVIEQGSLVEEAEAGVNSSRRKFITMAGAGLAALSFPGMGAILSEGVAQGGSAAKGKAPKIVWVLLRGALDSLHTVVPTFDNHYQALRPSLAKSFKKPLLPLDNGFALHPSLVNLHQWYQNKQLTPIVAVSSGYKRRSHFDGQDFLESGTGEINYDSGWLARAIDLKQKRALAVARAKPISLRSSENAYTWYPSNLKEADDDIYQSLIKLYQNDESLKENLLSGLELKGVIGKDGMGKGAKYNKKEGQFVELSKACAKLMTAEDGVDCAMLELGGWDTHNNQANRLNKKLSELDTGLAALKEGLGNDWNNTVVIVGTEFGRTAKENGTGGTDHGTGSAMFLAGGGIANPALSGGTVMGKWPGLATNDLFEQRDLMPTSTHFTWIAGVLREHWGFTPQEVQQVFPQLTKQA